MTTRRLKVGQPSINPAGIHRSLLAGLLSQLGIKDTIALARMAAQHGLTPPDLAA